MRRATCQQVVSLYRARKLWCESERQKQSRGYHKRAQVFGGVRRALGCEEAAYCFNAAGGTSSSCSGDELSARLTPSTSVSERPAGAGGARRRRPATPARTPPARLASPFLPFRMVFWRARKPKEDSAVFCSYESAGQPQRAAQRSLGVFVQI